ncbi:acyl-CoA thioesterase [Aspergillus melleus]|uniref:Acyl-CoA thioesterase n=1 Tax=Aspergillus melleus TaxID=138277 RepID=A0ACC3B2S6_9EURO|nr:acyl-CoA thioesterase [Aspergillus melleus]
MANKRVTLLEPPALDASKAPIENVLELTPVVDIGPDVFTNTRPLWHPPGARGIYGGAAIAQSLSAAMRTVPSDFAVHSMHCYFVLAGDSEIPILYHVERVRDGRSFITRTVQARQRGRPIFTTTLSFSKANSGGKKKLEHATPMPAVSLPDDSSPGSKKRFDEGGGGPFESQKAGVVNRDSNPEDKRLRRFVRARGKISDGGGHHAHLSALAYITDSYFVGTVSRVHDIPRFTSPAELKKFLNALKNPSDLDDEDISRALKELKEEETAELRRRLEGALSKATDEKNKAEHKEVGMMVSLDHSIYFHNPWAFRADEWMLTEMESPWAGEGRGLVLQKMWSKDGTLIATCTQEGVVRLKQDEPPRAKI